LISISAKLTRGNRQVLTSRNRTIGMSAVCARSIRRLPFRPQGSFNFCFRSSCSYPALARTQFRHIRPGSLVAPSYRRRFRQNVLIFSPSPKFRPWTGWATSTTPHSTTSDPAELEALQCLEQGTQKLEEGDVEAAKRLYKRSTEVKRTASSLYNLGVTHYHLRASSISVSVVTQFNARPFSCTGEYDDAIAVWKESIVLQPSSADAHTSTWALLSFWAIT
jgi:hypothetical protein